MGAKYNGALQFCSGADSYTRAECEAMPSCPPPLQQACQDALHLGVWKEAHPWSRSRASSVECSPEAVVLEWTWHNKYSTTIRTPGLLI